MFEVIFLYKWRCNTWQKKRDCRYGMRNGEGYIREKELKRVINMLKENKATYESGMIVEYIQALEERDSNNMRILLSRGCIPKECKENRVVLVYKGGSMKELKKYSQRWFVIME